MSVAAASRVRVIAHSQRVEAATLRAGLEQLRGHLPAAELDLCPTSGPGDARRLALEASEQGYDRVVAAGGDGTVHEVVTGLLDGGNSRPSLGIVPLGTANDLARALALPEELGPSLVAAATAHTRTVDVGYMHQSAPKSAVRPFINAISGGVASEATAATPVLLKRALGELAYIVAGLTKLAQLEPYELELQVGDQHWSGRAYALGIGNAPFVGGGFELCPGASLVDGLLEFTIVTEAALGAGNLVAMLERRSLAGAREIVHLRGAAAELHCQPAIAVNLDGEPDRLTGARFTLSPASIELAVPGTPAVLSTEPAPRPN